MTCAVHAINKNVISSLRSVLGYFHEQKHQRGVLSLAFLLSFANPFFNRLIACLLDFMNQLFGGLLK